MYWVFLAYAICGWLFLYFTWPTGQRRRDWQQLSCLVLLAACWPVTVLGVLCYSAWKLFMFTGE